MKFRCERDVLVEALGTVGRAVAGRSMAPVVLSGIRMQVVGDRLSLQATDLDLTIACELDVVGEQDGAVVVPAKLTSDIVRAFEPAAVTVEAGADDAHLSAGRSQFSVRAFAAEDFPRLAEAEGPVVELAAQAFAEALRQVVPAASPDPQRAILTGVLLAAEAGGLRLVATDSYRLALRDLAGSAVLREGEQVVVPSRALAELARLLGDDESVALRLGERDATFTAGGVRITTRLIEGAFPNYQRLFPEEYPNRLVVGREPFLDAVRRVRLLARDATPVRLLQRGDGLELLAVNPSMGEAREELDAKYEGTELTVAFNPEFLVTGAEAAVGDELILDTIDALKPAMLRSVEQLDFRYLLMPIRVS
ncbi:MAG: DNA polymerase III subunit beta [Acidimicrobiales bacterium]|nr:DNA polymerase III subunit beta [Acidimicrobiales bacterium]